MLSLLNVGRHHVFLLVTYAQRFSGMQRHSLHTQALAESMSDPLPGLVVAVVDDDPGILRSLAYLLESADYSVRLYASAAAFLYSDCLPEIDCLISDIDMPGKDGFELLQLVESKRPNLPTVLITGYPHRLKRLQPAGVSPSRVFIKPFRGPEILAAIGDAIRNAREW